MRYRLQEELSSCMAWQYAGSDDRCMVSDDLSAGAKGGSRAVSTSTAFSELVRMT